MRTLNAKKGRHKTGTSVFLYLNDDPLDFGSEIAYTKAVRPFCTELTLFCTALNQSEWRKFFLYILSSVLLPLLINTQGQIVQVHLEEKV